MIRTNLTRLARRVRGSCRRLFTPRHRPIGAALALLALEGRLVPSTTPFDLADHSFSADVGFIRTDATSLDTLVRLSPWTPTARTAWSDDDNQMPRESPTPMSVAAFMAVFLGTGVVFPYDREEDAEAKARLHGVRVG